jgi:3-hydroxybutyryl-CoA dehydrogenase
MTIGIATAVLMADRGHKVTLIDTKPRETGKENEALDHALAEIKANLSLLDELGMLRGDMQALAGNLGVTGVLEEGIAGCSYVFEALPEVVAIKQAFYKKIGRLMSEEAVVASATSTFHLDVFWEVCSRPESVISAHWLNPAFLIPLVEVGYGEKTCERATGRICDLLKDIGKIPVKMRTSPGFIVPRIQAAAMNEAVRILEEGVATAEEIDTAIKAGFGFRLGVLGLIEFVDLGGVDILFHAGEYLRNTLGGEHFKPPKLVKEKMDKAEMGPRTGMGFYDYEGVDTRALFDQRYRGFIELLRLYERSEYLNFSGGIAGNKPSKSDTTTTNRKEMP